MLARLLVNWPYKLMALVFACLLHFYVIGQQNPHQPRPFSVPLTPVNLPGGLLWNDQQVPYVSVVLDGPSDILNHVIASEVLAQVNLSHAHSGKNVALPVEVVLPPNVRTALTADVQPPRVTLTLEARQERTLRVQANPPGAVPVGYAFRPAEVKPSAAVISGPGSAVESVAHLVAQADSSGAVGTVDNDFAIVPLDAQGSQVMDVTVTPATAHVRIEMVKAPAMKSVLVSADIVGSPPFPYKVADVQVTPPTATIAGRPDRLAQTGTLTTAPIDVSGATSDMTRTVALVPPDGVTLEHDAPVKVTVHIVTQQPIVSPAPPSPTGPGTETPSPR